MGGSGSFASDGHGGRRMRHAAKGGRRRTRGSRCQWKLSTSAVARRRKEMEPLDAPGAGAVDDDAVDAMGAPRRRRVSKVPELLEAPTKVLESRGGQVSGPELMEVGCWLGEDWKRRTHAGPSVNWSDTLDNVQRTACCVPLGQIRHLSRKVQSKNGAWGAPYLESA
ncbi:hypothetical protein MAJ_01593, partial [Metarhizium majus ARSEF 297]